MRHCQASIKSRAKHFTTESNPFWICTKFLVTYDYTRIITEFSYHGGSVFWKYISSNCRDKNYTKRLRRAKLNSFYLSCQCEKINQTLNDNQWEYIWYFEILIDYDMIYIKWSHDTVFPLFQPTFMVANLAHLRCCKESK